MLLLTERDKLAMITAVRNFCKKVQISWDDNSDGNILMKELHNNHYNTSKFPESEPESV